MSSRRRVGPLTVPDDQHRLHLAPASALHRLRKNELIRLWKVSGMWSSDEEGDGDDGDQHGLSKVELVNGLIRAVGFFLSSS